MSLLLHVQISFKHFLRHSYTHNGFGYINTFLIVLILILILSSFLSLKILKNVGVVTAINRPEMPSVEICRKNLCLDYVVCFIYYCD